MQKKCKKCHSALKLRDGKNGKFFGCFKFPRCKYTEPYEASELNKSNWVRASDISQISFCPYSRYLAKLGIKKTDKVNERFEYGRKKHRKASKETACYIATYVFSESDPIVQDLRQWRNEYLLTNFYGVLFTKFYYAISPWLITLFGKSKIFKYICTRLVKKIHKKISTKVN